MANELRGELLPPMLPQVPEECPFCNSWDGYWSRFWSQDEHGTIHFRMDCLSCRRQFIVSWHEYGTKEVRPDGR